MARFYGGIRGSRGQATRLGHRRIEAEARGWNSGVRVVGRIDEDGNDVFDIYSTGGSNDPSFARLLGIVQRGSVVVFPLEVMAGGRDDSR